MHHGQPNNLQAHGALSHMTFFTFNAANFQLDLVRETHKIYRVHFIDAENMLNSINFTITFHFLAQSFCESVVKIGNFLLHFTIFEHFTNAGWLNGGL